MSDWEPEEYDSDPTVNALLNIAAGLHGLAHATNELLYGLKFSKQDGMSIAEAIEVSGDHIGESVRAVASEISQALEGIGAAPPVDDIASELSEETPDHE